MANRMWEMVVGTNNADDSCAGIYARLGDDNNVEIGYLTTGAVRVVTLNGDYQFTDDSITGLTESDMSKLDECEVVVHVVSKSGVTTVGITEMDETVVLGAPAEIYVDHSDEYLYDEMEEMDECYPQLADMLGVM